MTRLEFKRIAIRSQYCHYIQEDLQINLLLQDFSSIFWLLGPRHYINWVVEPRNVKFEFLVLQSKMSSLVPFFLILNTYSDRIKSYWLHIILFQTESLATKVCREISRKKVDLVPVHMSQSLSKFAFCWVFTAGVLFEGFDSLVGLSLCNRAQWGSKQNSRFTF